MLLTIVTTLDLINTMFVTFFYPIQLSNCVRKERSLINNTERRTNVCFRFRHSAGIDMLLYGETSSACNAVQLLFAGERPLRPVRLGLHGREFWAIPIADLLAMKLGSYRDKDRVHVRGMDAAGLITPEVESALSGELQQRLRHTRETE